MHEIDTDGNVANQFDAGDPGVPRNPTQVDAAWLNAVQNEIVNAIEGAGITLVKGTNTQLRTAMMNLQTNQSAAGVKTFTGNIVVAPTSGDTHAVTGTGYNHGSGGSFVGGGISGAGVTGTGGAGNSYGVVGTGNGTGVGVVATGGNTSGPGIWTKRGDGSTSGSALKCDGAIDFSAASDVSITTAVTNMLTKALVPKAWGYVTTNPATVHEGVNVATISANSTDTVITLAQGMASVYYNPSITAHQGNVRTTDVDIISATQFRVFCYDGSGALLDPTAVTCKFSFNVFGKQ